MSENASGLTGTDDVAAIHKLGKTRDAIISELRKTIVGMDDVIDEMMIAIKCLLASIDIAVQQKQASKRDWHQQNGGDVTCQGSQHQ